MFAALAKIGAVFAPLNARASLDGGRRRSPSTPGRGCCSPARRIADAGARARAATWACRSRPTCSGARPASPTPAAADRRRRARPHVIFFTSGSTGRPKGVVLSHRANWLRTFVGATTTRRRRRHGVHVPAVPHGGLDDRARCVAGAAAGALRARARRGDAAATTAPAPRRAPLLHPRGVGAACSSTASTGTTCRALDGGRHRHVGDAARAARARSRTRSRTPRRACSTARPKRGPGVALGRRRPVSQAGQRRRRAAGRGGAARRARRSVRAQPVPDGRLLRRSRRDRRGAASTAGTTRATSARSTTTATCRSSAGRAT